MPGSSGCRAHFGDSGFIWPSVFMDRLLPCPGHWPNQTELPPSVLDTPSLWLKHRGNYHKQPTPHPGIRGRSGPKRAVTGLCRRRSTRTRGVRFLCCSFSLFPGFAAAPLVSWDRAVWECHPRGAEAPVDVLNQHTATASALLCVASKTFDY